MYTCILSAHTFTRIDHETLFTTLVKKLAPADLAHLACRQSREHAGYKDYTKTAVGNLVEKIISKQKVVATSQRILCL